MIQTITIRDELFAAYRLRSDFIRHTFSREACCRPCSVSARRRNAPV